MRKAHALRLMLHRLPINDGVLELFHDRLVNRITLESYQFPRAQYGRRTHKILYGTCILSEHHRRVVVWRFALWLGVNPSKLELLPHLLKQLVDVPPVFRADRTSIRDTVDQIQLLDRNGVDLVQRIDDGNVAPALGFQNVDEVVNGGITSNRNIRRRDFVFTHHSLDLLADVSDSPTCSRDKPTS